MHYTEMLYMNTKLTGLTYCSLWAVLQLSPAKQTTEIALHVVMNGEGGG